MKLRAVLVIFAVAACFGTVLHADNMVFDRGLPTDNLNNGAGTNRSNVAWGDPTPSGGQNWAIGDTFSVGAAGNITDLRVWIVAKDSQPPSSMWTDLTLFGGTAADITALSTVSTGADPNVQITSVTYADGTTYQGSSGSFINLYQVDFLLNWGVAANTPYYFFVGGTPTAGVAVSPYLSSSNKALSGSPQQGADNLIGEIGYTGSGSSFTYSTDPFDAAPYWDKSSDVNVQIFATPEPTSVILLATLMLMVGALAPRKYQQRRRLE